MVQKSGSEENDANRTVDNWMQNVAPSTIYCNGRDLVYGSFIHDAKSSISNQCNAKNHSFSFKYKAYILANELYKVNICSVFIKSDPVCLMYIHVCIMCRLVDDACVQYC